jgi:hypothetical protein
MQNSGYSKLYKETECMVNMAYILYLANQFTISPDQIIQI